MKYNVSIKRVSGRLNESVLPSKSLVINSRTKKSAREVLAEASKYYKKKYGLVIESADIETNDTKNFFEELRKTVSAQNERSAWGRGVKEYALEMIDNLEEYDHGKVPADFAELKKMALNGASDWYQASEGGSWLIYNEEIAERLCSPSELKKVANGSRRPNARESWLDVQARALNGAFKRVYRAAYDIWKKR